MDGRKAIKMKILVLNGPNMNMLGIREPDIYGRETYQDLVDLIKREKGDRHEITFCQSNHEGDLVDAIQRAYFTGVQGIVFNPAAYTHTSVAIADAVKAVGIPTIEVHVSDPDSREEFRKVSYIRKAAAGTVAGRGFQGYIDAIDMLEEIASR